MIKSRPVRFSAIAIFAFGVVFLILRSLQPSYGGYTARAWFYHPLKASGIIDYRAERRAFQAFGTDAAPYLLREFERDQTPFQPWIKRFLPKRIDSLWTNRRQFLQARAADLLGETGANSDYIIALLNTKTNSTFIPMQLASTAAIMKLRGDPIQPIIDSLERDISWSQWYKNVGLIAKFGPEAKHAVPLLLAALDDLQEPLKPGDHTTATELIGALGDIGSEAELCVPVIIPFLKSVDRDIRISAIHAIAQFGEDAAEAVPTLSHIAESDPIPILRKKAHQARRLILKYTDAKGEH